MLENKANIVLLIQNAYTAFCYYNVPTESIRQFDKQYGNDSYNNSKPIIKVKIQKGNYCIEMDTITLDPFADNWYISLKEDDCDIFLELYRKLPDNREHFLAKSNIVTVPRRELSKDLTCEYMDLSNY